jgi:hypothetical protein
MTTRGVQDVETIASYANQVEGVVNLVLHLPDEAEAAAEGAAGGAGATLRLRRANRGPAVTAPATTSPAEGGALLESHISSDQLPPGVWRMWLRPAPDAPEIRLQARLLTSRKQPIALLTGPAPRIGGSPAIPRPRRAEPTPPSARGRLRGFAVKGVDAALSRLPEERASRYRAGLVNAARRVGA